MSIQCPKCQSGLIGTIDAGRRVGSSIRISNGGYMPTFAPDHSMALSI